MTVFGVGEIFGCQILGYLIDRIGTKKTVLLIELIIISMIVVTVIYIN
jgi:predicted MFS family arabinose efflux permease